MSYAGWVVLPSENPHDWAVTLDELGNYTSNVSGMWWRALEAVTGDGMRLQDTQGWTCERAAPVLTLAVVWMGEHADELRRLEPDNGWGDYEGAVEYMRSVAEKCRTYADVRNGVGPAELRWYC